MGNPGIAHSAEGKNLLELMTADIGEDAAAFERVEEPCRASGLGQAMGCEAKDMDDLSQASRGNDLPGHYGRGNVHALAVIDEDLPSGFPNELPGFLELGEGGSEGFCRKKILS